MFPLSESWREQHTLIHWLHLGLVLMKRYITSSRCAICSHERGAENKEGNDNLSQTRTQPQPSTHWPINRDAHANTQCVWGHGGPEKNHPKERNAELNTINKTTKAQNSPFLQRTCSAGVCLLGGWIFSIFWSVFLCRSLASTLEF